MARTSHTPNRIRLFDTNNQRIASLSDHEAWLRFSRGEVEAVYRIVHSDRLFLGYSLLPPDPSKSRWSDACLTAADAEGLVAETPHHVHRVHEFRRHPAWTYRGRHLGYGIIARQSLAEKEAVMHSRRREDV